MASVTEEGGMRESERENSPEIFYSVGTCVVRYWSKLNFITRQSGGGAMAVAAAVAATVAGGKAVFPFIS